MPGRHALIVSADADDDVSALAAALKKRKVGGFKVNVTDEREKVDRFLASREGGDDVLIYLAADAPVKPSAVATALKDCASQHVLVLLEGHERINLANGRGSINGASAGAVVAALEHADSNRDGTVVARELYRALRALAPKGELPVHRSKLGGTFKVAQSRFAQPARKPIERAPMLLVAGIALLVIGLFAPWLYGGIGLKLAFWPDTSFGNRVGALATCALALLTAVFLLRRSRAWSLLIVATGATYGCVLAWLWFQEEAEYGFGVAISMLGPLLILAVAGLSILSSDPEESDDDPEEAVQAERWTAAMAAGAGLLVVLEVDPAIATDYFVLAAGVLAGVPLLIPHSGRLRALAPMFVGALILNYDAFGPLAFYPLFLGAFAIIGGWAIL